MSTTVLGIQPTEHGVSDIVLVHKTFRSVTGCEILDGRDSSSLITVCASNLICRIAANNTAFDGCEKRGHFYGLSVFGCDERSPCKFLAIEARLDAVRKLAGSPSPSNLKAEQCVSAEDERSNVSQLCKSS